MKTNIYKKKYYLFLLIFIIFANFSVHFLFYYLYKIQNKDFEKPEKPENIEFNISKNVIENYCKEYLLMNLYSESKEKGNFSEFKVKEIDGFASSIDNIHCFSNVDILTLNKDQNITLRSDKKYYYRLKYDNNIKFSILTKKDIMKAFNSYKSQQIKN